MIRRLVLLLGMLSVVPAAADILYVGSYTSGTSKGIYAWRFDEKSGALSPLGLAAATPQPAHIWISPNGKFLYTVNWEQAGGVSAFRIDARTGGLSFLNRVSAHGALPNQVVLDPSGRVAVTVNYASGSLAAYGLEPDGKLGEAFYVDRHTAKPEASAQAGATNNKSAKQPSAKQHGIQFSADDKYMFVTDLGLDRVYSYRFDASVPSLAPADPPYVETHAGAGPRRIQMSPDGKFLYVNHETDSEVSVFAIHDGVLKPMQVIGTVPPEAKAKNSTAELVISPDGRFLYVGNRGNDSVSIFAIDRKTGLLRLKENTPSGGRTPRNLRIDPSGNWFFAANEGSGNVTEFKRDKNSGRLAPTGVKVFLDTPGGLYFLKTR